MVRKVLAVIIAKFPNELGVCFFPFFSSHRSHCAGSFFSCPESWNYRRVRGRVIANDVADRIIKPDTQGFRILYHHELMVQPGEAVS